MKKIACLITLLIALSFSQSAFADNVIPAANTVRTTPSTLDFAKSYKVNAENLFICTHIEFDLNRGGKKSILLPK